MTVEKWLENSICLPIEALQVGQIMISQNHQIIIEQAAIPSAQQYGSLLANFVVVDGCAMALECRFPTFTSL